jgi:predicted transcriptional regulator with HTH domain
MRATIDGVEIEGSPEEIAAVLTALRDPASVKSDSAKAAVESDPEDGNPITEDFAYRAIRRLPLSRLQRGLLLSLKKAHPKWVLASELQTALDTGPTSLGGVFGGLGRRVSATKGHQRGYNLWDWKWDDDEGQWAYRLPATVVTALNRAGV